MKKVRVLFSVLGLGLVWIFTVQCSTSPSAICENMGKAINAKVGGCTGVTSKFDQNKCQETVSQCNSDDRVKISATITCIENIEACASGNEFKFVADLAGCSAKAQGISDGCETAITFSD